MKTAVITGATQGIGKAIAERLLSEGFSVAVCARSEAGLKAVQNEWKSKFPVADIIALPADLGKKEAAKEFADAVLMQFKTVDILVNNAGLFFPGKLMEEPEGQLEELMNINLYSAYNLTRLLVPSMKENKSGHIFNICSVAGLQAYENGGAYGITKYALRGFSENLRFELKPYRIKVTAIMPGATWSRSWSSSGLPEERFMKAEDIAEMLWASYVLSNQATVETIVMRPMEGDI